MSGLIKSGLAAVSVLVLTTLASGGIATDSNGMSQWRGTVKFKYSSFIDANVQYCVYAPTHFSLSFPAWDDPTDGTEYVYAYQIYNNNTKYSVARLSIGMRSGDEAGNIFYFSDDSSHKDPNTWDINASGGGTTAGWDFTTLTSGTISDILYFTSPFSPEPNHSATIKGPSGITTSGLLPCPNPEPTTVVLLGTGLIFLANLRVRRKKQ